MTGQSRWRRLIDNVLCPYFLGDGLSSTDFESEEIWRDYYFMMECFFDRIHEIYTPGDVIMVHDYHLMMLPRLLRQRLPDAHVTFSMHTPCRRILEMSGRLGEFIEGILGSNLITFLEPEDAVDFRSWCVKNSLDRPSYWAARAMNSITSTPTGIDVSGIISVAQSEAFSERCEILRSFFKNRLLVLSYGTPGSKTEMEEVSRGYFRMLEQAPWWKGLPILFEVVCTSRADDSLEEYNMFDDLFGSIESADSIWYKGYVSELDFHALARCSNAAIFSFAPGGPMTAALEYFVCQPRGSKRPIASLSNPIAHQVLGVIPYRRGDYDSIAGAINYALRLPGGLRMGTPRLEDYDVGIFNTAEWWTKAVLRDLMKNLLRACRPAGTSDTSVRGSRSPEAFAGAWDPSEELIGEDGRSFTGDGGGDSTESHDDCDEGDDDGDYTDNDGEEDGGEDGEEEDAEGDAELKSFQDGISTPSEAQDTLSGRGKMAWGIFKRSVRENDVGISVIMRLLY